MLVGGQADDSQLLQAMSPTFETTSDGVQDTFVFNLGEGAISFMGSDKIADFVDGEDKIAISDDSGTTYEATPFGSGLLTSTQMNMGLETYTVVHKADNSEFVFYVEDAVTFDDTDITTVVT